VAGAIHREEYVKRADFVLMVTLAVHDKGAGDAEFIKFLSIINREASDDRNFIKKATNWALRQIGKRNPDLNKKAIEISEARASGRSRCRSILA